MNNKRKLFKIIILILQLILVLVVILPDLLEYLSKEDKKDTPVLIINNINCRFRSIDCYVRD